MSKFRPTQIGTWDFAKAVEWLSDSVVVIGADLDEGISSLDLLSHEVSQVELPPELEGFEFASFTDRRIRNDSPIRAILESSRDEDQYALATFTRNDKLELNFTFAFEDAFPTVFQVGEHQFFFVEEGFYRLGILEPNTSRDLRKRVQLESNPSCQILRVWPISETKAVLLRAEPPMNLAAYELTIQGPRAGECDLLWEKSSLEFNDACCQANPTTYAVFCTDLDSGANVVTEFSGTHETTFVYDSDPAHFTPKAFYSGGDLWFFSTRTCLSRMDTAKQRIELRFDFEESVSILGLRDNTIAVQNGEDEIFLVDLNKTAP